jgi:clan AA aspartic protease
VNGATFPIEFVIDTGFTDHLCLPPEAVKLLRLPFLYNLPANLADNSSVVLPVHQATIFWDGAERDVRVFATGRRPLVTLCDCFTHNVGDLPLSKQNDRLSKLKWKGQVAFSLNP